MGQTIIFEADGKAIEMPLTGCAIALGGTGNKQAYITHPKHADTTMQINDFSLFKHPAFDQHQAAQKFRQEQSRHNGLLYGGIIVACLIILIPFYLIFIERSFLIGKLAQAIPAQYDIKIGDMVVQADDSNMIQDEAIMAELQIMAAPLIKAAQKEPFTYGLHIAMDDAVNAYAVPGGHIVLNAGLIAKTETPEELLGVIAHEIAHINQRHSMKRMMHGVSSWLFFSMLGADPNHVVALFADQAGAFSARSYSRYHEHEADKEGFDALLTAGIDPSGLRGFFQILQQEESTLGQSQIAGLLSTHPLTEDRMAAMDDVLNQAPMPAKGFLDIPIDYEAFKASVAQAVLDAETPSAPDSSIPDHSPSPLPHPPLKGAPTP